MMHWDFSAKNLKQEIVYQVIILLIKCCKCIWSDFYFIIPAKNIKVTFINPLSPEFFTCR